MITKFQREVSIDLLKKITKFFHPDLTEEQLDKIKWYYKYSWVCIQFRVKDYGYISIGINNHEANPPIWGPISKEYVSHAFESKRIVYRIWRFVDDKLYKNHEIQSDNNVVFHGEIPLPSQQEYYDYYMKD